MLHLTLLHFWVKYMYIHSNFIESWYKTSLKICEHYRLELWELLECTECAVDYRPVFNAARIIEVQLL